MNSQEYLHDLFRIILYYSEFIRIYTNVYVFNLCDNMLSTTRQPHTTACTAGQPHTVALLDSHTLPRILPYRRTLPHTAAHSCAHCRTQLCALPQTAAHCMNPNAGQPHTAHCILHTAHRFYVNITLWFSPPPQPPTWVVLTSTPAADVTSWGVRTPPPAAHLSFEGVRTPHLPAGRMTSAGEKTPFPADDM
jgi:hypothetical protein